MAFPPYTSDHTGVSLTSRAEIERMFSYKGVSLHLDDLDSDDDNYDPNTHADATVDNFISEVVQRATSRVMEYLHPRYEADDVETVPSVREITTILACHDLTRRRGNEPVYEHDVADGYDRLEQYRDGTLYLNAIPRGPRALVQSYVTDSRYYRNPTRVLRLASTSIVPGQNLAWDYPFFWL